jgi:predicted dehydrogenase
LYVLGGAKIETVTCDAYNEMAKDMKAYKHHGMWAQETSDVENGTNDVDDFISGYVRTDVASISFNGAWAQNIDSKDRYVDILGDKGGARLTYGGQFTFTSGETLESYTSEIDIPDMYLCEDKAFFESIDSGVKDKNNIENILESAKLLDSLYASAEKKEEIRF